MNVVQFDHSHVHFSRESYIRKRHLEEVSIVIVEENYITRKIVFDKKKFSSRSICKKEIIRRCLNRYCRRGSHQEYRREIIVCSVRVLRGKRGRVRSSTIREEERRQERRVESKEKEDRRERGTMEKRGRCTHGGAGLAFCSTVQQAYRCESPYTARRTVNEKGDWRKLKRRAEGQRQEEKDWNGKGEEEKESPSVAPEGDEQPTTGR